MYKLALATLLTLNQLKKVGGEYMDPEYAKQVADAKAKSDAALKQQVDKSKTVDYSKAPPAKVTATIPRSGSSAVDDLAKTPAPATGAPAK